MNFLAIIAAAIVPLFIGFIWYNNNVFGKAWMQAAEMTEEKMKGANMGIIFGVSLILSVLLSVEINVMVIHQMHLDSLFFGDESPEGIQQLAALQEQLGDRFRTFRHGAFHGGLAGIFFALPVLGINALFERKGFKYVAVNAGYWILTLAIMGGIICGWV